MKQHFERSRSIAEGTIFWLSEPETGVCQVDECDAIAVVDVDAPVSVKGIRCCYRHMSAALEDVGWHIKQLANRDRRRLIEVMKQRLPEDKKAGYEYP